MQRSSESIATLAAALAKAQAELSNPEKSLMATIEPTPFQPKRTFRYAPLSTGLDIVRKALGHHEIATIQSTAVDQESGLIKLTTTLAHASGEWIASDWPVCPLSDMATPHRMGAALTYARRYALFTLVGIAGEDDLDAPDVAAPAPASGLDAARPSRNVHTSGNGATPMGPRPGRRNSRFSAGPCKPGLTEAESAVSRDQLLSELAGLVSEDELASWARKILPVKNTLTAPDARLLEDAFASKMTALSDAEPDQAPATAKTDPASIPPRKLAGQSKTRRQPSKPRGTDKSLLAFPEPRCLRDKEHLRFVAKQPCLICGRQPADAHHIRFAQLRALGRKVSDEFTVPVCRTHHREIHRCGDEATWWSQHRIDPLNAAATLWRQTHPLPAQSQLTVPAQSVAGTQNVDNGQRADVQNTILGRTDDKTNPIVPTDPQ